MTQLYIELYSLQNEEAEVPVQSAVCLFLLSYLQNPPTILLNLVTCDQRENQLLKVNLRTLHYQTIRLEDLPPLVNDCCLPVFMTSDTTSCVAGLCAVLRQVVKHSGEEWRQLLGFREGCLFACAEVSLWTKFCEIDILEMVHGVLSKTELINEEITIPEHLVRFEEHLKQPVRMHNLDKLRHEIEKDSVDHDFAEGYTMSLADLIIFPCVHIYFQALENIFLTSYLPLVFRWYKLVKDQKHVIDALSIIASVSWKVNKLHNIKCVMPEVSRHSLYKSDPKRYKPKWKQFTRQEDVEDALRVVESLEVDLDYSAVPYGSDIPLDWESVPRDVQPDVPESRLARKRQQLENLSKAIIKMAKPRDRIVDFCCGSGHLGIVVAYCLPSCQVVLLDNKEESLARAKARVNQLALSNVSTVQCNLDYFRGTFQIGTSLHACGVASDLVIQTCLQQKAAFVVCPCCYGSLQSNHMVSYPRSSIMSPLSPRQYLVLGHCADQTHKQLYNKSAQGERCMTVVDHDRCLEAKERGYSTWLSKLIPTTCSPKNNLLVGIPHSDSVT